MKKALRSVASGLVERRQSGGAVTIENSNSSKGLFWEGSADTVSGVTVDDFALCDAAGRKLTDGKVADLYYALEAEKRTKAKEKQYQEL